MKVAVVTLEGFNELDSFIAAPMLNRAKRAGIEALIVAPEDSVVSMNGVRVERQAPLEFANEAHAVLFGSGTRTRDYAKDGAFISKLKLDPERQLIGAQCSGTLLLAKLGLLRGVAACTDSTTKPWVVEAGVAVLEQPFVANGNVATAGGCLASHYLAAWMIARLGGVTLAREVVHYVAPVGEKDEYVERAFRAIGPFVQPVHSRAAPLRMTRTASH